jgi:pyruvate dehydrogenase E2 component (dihydrolipoamide acetyltransferase)
MPQMGESIAEGTVSRWLKKVGDEVKRDEPIFEISTDKVDAEIPSPIAGVLAEIIVTEGTTVAIQTVVARIETEKGASIAPSAPAPAPVAAAPAPAVAASAPATAPSAPAAPVAAAPVHVGAGNGSFEDRVRTKSSPLVRRIAADKGIEIAALTGTGIAGRVTKKDLIGFLESGAAIPAPSMPAGLPSSVAVPASAM